MQSDWKELIATLTAHEVEFIVVGAHALAFHARPRYTEDLDLFLRRGEANGVRLMAALHEFGIPIKSEAVKRLMEEENQMVVLGHEPFAIDLLNFISGVAFDDAWANKVEGQVGGQAAFILGLEEYVATKRAAGRPKDLADLAILNEFASKQ